MSSNQRLNTNEQREANIRKRWKDNPQELERRLNNLKNEIYQPTDPPKSSTIYRYPPYELIVHPSTFHNKEVFLAYYSMFDAYSRNGVLPYSGGYMNQPSKLIEILDLLGNLKSEHEAKQYNKARKKKSK